MTGPGTEYQAELSPEFARDLRRVARRKDAAEQAFQEVEQAFRDVILRGRSEGMSIAAMAREIDPSGGISRQLLWQWIRAWENEGTT